MVGSEYWMIKEIFICKLSYKVFSFCTATTSVQILSPFGILKKLGTIESPTQFPLRFFMHFQVRFLLPYEKSLNLKSNIQRNFEFEIGIHSHLMIYCSPGIPFLLLNFRPIPILTPPRKIWFLKYFFSCLYVLFIQFGLKIFRNEKS